MDTKGRVQEETTGNGNGGRIYIYIYIYIYIVFWVIEAVRGK